MLPGAARGIGAPSHRVIGAYNARPLDNAPTMQENAPAEQRPPYDFIPAALVKEDLVVGSGTRADDGDGVLVHYVGWLAEGRTQFDSSRTRGDPLDFALGAGQVIRGLEQGIAGMRVGGKRRLTIPAALAYGEQGSGVIPPNATLVFEVELLRVS